MCSDGEGFSATEGPYTETTARAVREVEAWPVVAEGEYDLRVLRLKDAWATRRLLMATKTGEPLSAAAAVVYRGNIVFTPGMLFSIGLVATFFLKEVPLRGSTYSMR